MRAVGEAEGRLDFPDVAAEKRVLTPATHHYTTGPAGVGSPCFMVVRRRDPRSRCLILFDVLPDLIVCNPVFLADLDRLQALGLDHFPYCLYIDLEHIGDFFSGVKDRGGNICTSWRDYIHVINPRQGA